ncbi:MAG: hypothetical protein J6B43_02960 [Lachnospiraceae bacterium]|nr:hypothetical protein [Lachnospiraceae bacterium]
MEFEEIKEWLDWHVADIKERKEHRHFDNNIRTCYPGDDIQMSKGIELVADILGAKLEERQQGDYRRLSFMYGETEVIQLDRREDA